MSCWVATRRMAARRSGPFGMLSSRPSSDTSRLYGNSFFCGGAGGRRTGRQVCRRGTAAGGNTGERGARGCVLQGGARPPACLQPHPAPLTTPQAPPQPHLHQVGQGVGARIGPDEPGAVPHPPLALAERGEELGDGGGGVPHHALVHPHLCAVRGGGREGRAGREAGRQGVRRCMVRHFPESSCVGGGGQGGERGSRGLRGPTQHAALAQMAVMLPPPPLPPPHLCLAKLGRLLDNHRPPPAAGGGAAYIAAAATGVSTAAASAAAFAIATAAPLPAVVAAAAIPAAAAGPVARVAPFRRPLRSSSGAGCLHQGGSVHGAKAASGKLAPQLDVLLQRQQRRGMGSGCTAFRVPDLQGLNVDRVALSSLEGLSSGAAAAAPPHLSIHFGGPALQRRQDVGVDPARRHARAERHVGARRRQQRQALRVHAALLHAQHGVERAAGRCRGV